MLSLILGVAWIFSVASAELDFEDEPLAPRHHFRSFPSYITRIRDGDTYILRLKYDVLVLLAVSSRNCEACEAAARNFQLAAEAIRNDKFGAISNLLEPNATVDSTIHFAYLDVIQEMEEFESIVRFREGLRTPTLMVFKREYQQSLKLPALIFSIHDELPTALTSFVGRAMGPLIRRPTMEEDIARILSSAATQRAAVGVWMDALPRALRQSLPSERLEAVWFQMPPPEEADPALVEMFNPAKADVVVYHYAGEGANLRSIDPMDVIFVANVTFDKTLANNENAYFDHVNKAMWMPLRQGKRLRPGHEFDYIRKQVLRIDDVSPACSRTAKRGDRIKGRVEGVLTGTLHKFADTKEETFTVGRHRGDFPDYINEEGFLDMCEGSVRRIGIPPGKFHYDVSDLPPGVPSDIPIVFRMQLDRFLNDEL